MSQFKLSGIEELRKIVAFYSWQCEDFNTEFTIAQLIKLYRIHQQTGWDIYPDRWSDWQINAALNRDIIPQWETDETTPLDSTRKATFT